jgi:hypothetical protein
METSNQLRMGDVEMDSCDFCKEVKPVERTYLRPSWYVKSDDSNHLYNEGNYFIIVKTCSSCGPPKL